MFESQELIGSQDGQIKCQRKQYSQKNNNLDYPFLCMNKMFNSSEIFFFKEINPFSKIILSNCTFLLNCKMQWHGYYPYNFNMLIFNIIKSILINKQIA